MLRSKSTRSSAASATLAGIEVAHIIKKGQFDAVGRHAFQQFVVLALDVFGSRAAPCGRLGHFLFESNRAFPAQSRVLSARTVKAVDVREMASSAFLRVCHDLVNDDQVESNMCRKATYLQGAFRLT